MCCGCALVEGVLDRDRYSLFTISWNARSLGVGRLWATRTEKATDDYQASGDTSVRSWLLAVHWTDSSSMKKISGLELAFFNSRIASRSSKTPPVSVTDSLTILTFFIPGSVNNVEEMCRLHFFKNCQLVIEGLNFVLKTLGGRLEQPFMWFVLGNIRPYVDAWIIRKIVYAGEPNQVAFDAAN